VLGLGVTTEFLVELTQMTMIRHRYPRAAGLFLLAGGILLLPAGVAQAQFNPQDLLKQVLPGATENSDDSIAAGERACQRYAENQGLDVRDIGQTRRSGTDNLEVTLSVEDRNDRYDARCVYDTSDQDVRELVPIRTSSNRSRTARQDSDVDERLAQRAQYACEKLAEDRDLEDVDFAEAQARGHDTVEIDLRARAHGDQQSLTCLYDDDQHHAVLAE
jgi:hypothetical protein